MFDRQLGKGDVVHWTADDAEVVGDVIARITAAWRAKRYAELGRYFHENMVITAPGFGGRVKGREACVGTFKEFLEGATITRFQQDALTVDVWGDTAVVSYAWEMTWDTGGAPGQEKGHDVFVLSRAAVGSSPAWRAVWRTMIAESAS